MSQLVERSIFVHRREILDNLIALSYTDCDHRTLYIMAVAIGVADEFSRRAGGAVLLISQKAAIECLKNPEST